MHIFFLSDARESGQDDDGVVRLLRNEATRVATEVAACTDDRAPPLCS